MDYQEAADQFVQQVAALGYRRIGCYFYGHFDGESYECCACQVRTESHIRPRKHSPDCLAEKARTILASKKQGATV